MPSSIRREATRAVLITAFVQIIAAACDPTTAVDPTDEKKLLVPEASLMFGVSSLTASTVSWSEIDLSWPTSSSASGYQVFRSTTGAAGAYNLVASTAANVGNYADKGLTASTQYCYEIRSFKNSGKNTTYSAYSSPACATTSPPPVVAPSETNAVPQGTQILITWKDNSDNEDGFHIQSAPTSTGPWVQAVDAVANVTSGTVSAQPEQQTCFRVVAYSTAGASPPSGPDCTTMPATPTNLTALSYGPQSISLGWTDNSAVEEGYTVYRMENGGDFTVVATLPPNSQGYDDNGLRADVSYTYHVQAVKDGGYSNMSNDAVAVSPSTVPPAPTGASAALVYDGSLGLVFLFVEWSDASTSVMGFRIEYSSDGVNDWYFRAEVGPVTFFQDQFNINDAPSQLCIRVIAYNLWGDSDPSNVSCASFDPTQIVPGEFVAPNKDLSYRVGRAGSGAKGLTRSGAVVNNRAGPSTPLRVKRAPHNAFPIPSKRRSR